MQVLDTMESIKKRFKTNQIWIKQEINPGESANKKRANLNFGLDSFCSHIIYLLTLTTNTFHNNEV